MCAGATAFSMSLLMSAAARPAGRARVAARERRGHATGHLANTTCSTTTLCAQATAMKTMASATAPAWTLRFRDRCLINAPPLPTGARACPTAGRPTRCGHQEAAAAVAGVKRARGTWPTSTSRGRRSTSILVGRVRCRRRSNGSTARSPATQSRRVFNAPQQAHQAPSTSLSAPPPPHLRRRTCCAVAAAVQRAARALSAKM
mmetsp:Transcript_37196/g.81760  ORF Transcript_37196/g.81760 Transcript_37196/m.81760 type:complete len:203 (-) Transcript_37196:1901-2509(-)